MILQGTLANWIWIWRVFHFVTDMCSCTAWWGHFYEEIGLIPIIINSKWSVIFSQPEENGLWSASTNTTADEAKRAVEEEALRLPNLLGDLYQDFQWRFEHFSNWESLIQIVLNPVPFNADPEMISNTAANCDLPYTNFEFDIIELQENIEPKQRRLMSETFCDFWKLVKHTDLPRLLHAR